MSSQTAVSARGAYRQLLRATRVAFRGSFDMLDRQQVQMRDQVTDKTLGIDDARVLVASRQEARKNFDSHRRLGIDTPMRINHAIEVANLLKHNLVQGVRESNEEDANWGMCNFQFFVSLGLSFVVRCCG